MSPTTDWSIPSIAGRTPTSGIFQSLIALTKVGALELAVQIVLTALSVCGLSGYRCDSDFSIEPLLHDVPAAPLMINYDRIPTNLASTSLRTPIPASLRD